jgi:Mn-dependent DtxR family transcriptional regulator
LARATQLKHQTPRSEDYLEAIYHLVKDKGYASTLDIAESLQVGASSVSSMIKSLASGGYLSYEPYRGMRLTEKGERVARSVVSSHEILVEFLTMLGVDKTTAYNDAEGIEHHLHPESARALEGLTSALRRNHGLLKIVREHTKTE